MGALAGGMFGGPSGGSGGISPDVPGMKGLTGGRYGGALSNYLGTAGGFQGTGVPNPTLAQVQTPVTNEQIEGSQADIQNSMGSQQNLLAALQGQDGLGLQNSAASNQYDTMAQMQGRLPQTGGVKNQQGTYSALGNLANQYQNVANGTGPNPAQAMLNQQTGANVANQSAMMAGQRGAGANTGMMARQAGQQGAATQQQAVGQGATMQANQQLGALGQMGNVYGQQGNIAGQQVGQLQNQQQQYANQANQVAGQQIGQTNANVTAQQTNQGQLLQGMGNQNTANVAAQGNVNTANAALANAALGNKTAVQGGMFNAAGSMIGMMAAHGGLVENYADGGAVAPEPAATQMPMPQNGPQSSFGQFVLQNIAAPTDEGASLLGMNPQPYGTGGKSGGKKGMAIGGMAQHGGSVQAQNQKQKATVSGDNYANDKVKTVLSEGEVVIPRSVMQSKDPSGGAARFVAAVLAKKGRK